MKKRWVQIVVLVSFGFLSCVMGWCSRCVYESGAAISAGLDHWQTRENNLKAFWRRGPADEQPRQGQAR